MTGMGQQFLAWSTKRYDGGRAVSRRERRARMRRIILMMSGSCV